MHLNKFNHMRKEYEIPLSEEISIYEIDPVCGVSGGDYSGTGGNYDDDSD